jgi:protein SCO1/2
LLLTMTAIVSTATVVVVAQNARWGAGYFPDVTLTTHDGTPVRFYDDLLKGKIVAINLIYTSCQYACPLETARLAQVQKVLGDRVGRDVFFYSISIDPEHDTPAVLKEYAKQYNVGPGWLFLTGNKADIDLVSKKLGLYSPPGANADGHTPYLLIGNEATGQWMRNSAVDNPKILAERIGDWLDSWQSGPKSVPSYVNAPKLTLNQGQYAFSRHCAACHSIGGGDHLGPDLRGVTAKRDRAWLTRFIVEPNKVLAEGDAIARALDAKYPQVRMPNLSLSPADAAAIIGHIDAESERTAVSGTTERAPAGGGNTQAGAVDLARVVASYLKIQRALNADTLDGVPDSARTMTTEAVRLGAAGGGIVDAARAFEKAATLMSARQAFAAVSDAILLLVKTSAPMPPDVEVAYCPMARKYWLQVGDKIQNPYYGQSMSECGRISAVPTLN